jgi:prepilin-type N-terminal cleavage/methylation domain-containing protein
MGAMKGEKGFSLLEVALAMALLGVVAAALLTGLTYGSRYIIVADERATAESLARTQMEFIRQQPYDSNLGTGHPVYQVIPAGDIPEGYDITVNAVRLDYKHDGDTNDDGIQSITVTVMHTIDEETKTYTLVGLRSRR